MIDPYPEETASLNALPDECPIKYIEYGLITELIQDQVGKLRLVYRKDRIAWLVKKCHMKHLKQCFYELDYLGKLDPSNQIISLKKQRGKISTKGKIIDFLKNNFVPLIYLEDVHKKQLEGFPKFKPGDWVQVTDERNRGAMGIVSYDNEVLPQKNHDQLYVHFQWKKKGYNNKKKYIDDPSAPLNNQHLYSTQRISPWSLTKIGEDTESIKKLRDKSSEEYTEKLNRKILLWTTKVHPLLKDEFYSTVINDRLHQNNRGRYINYMRNNLNRQYGNEYYGPELSDDMLYSRALSLFIDRELIYVCKGLWFYDDTEIDVMDIEFWKTGVHKWSKYYIANKSYYNPIKQNHIDSVEHIILKYNILEGNPVILY